MSKLEKKYGTWIYISNGGHKYTIGEITAEHNVIIDDFDDIVDLFDTNVLIYDEIVGYCGDMNDKDTIVGIDEMIDHYEKYERKVKFRRDIVSREDALYEVYLGTEEEKEDETPKRISCMDMFRFAKEDRV